MRCDGDLHFSRRLSRSLRCDLSVCYGTRQFETDSRTIIQFGLQQLDARRFLHRVEHDHAQGPAADLDQGQRIIASGWVQTTPRFSSSKSTSQTTCLILSCSGCWVRGAHPAGGGSTSSKSARMHCSTFASESRSDCWADVCGWRLLPKSNPRNSAAARKPSGNSKGYSIA